MYVDRHVVTVTTNSSGDGTNYTPHIRGRVLQIIYAKTDFADGVDFTITNDATGEGIWTQSDINASTVRAPRIATHSNAGAAALYAGGGSAVLDYFAVGGDRIKIVVAQGGDTKTGTFHVIVG